MKDEGFSSARDRSASPANAPTSSRAGIERPGSAAIPSLRSGQTLAASGDRSGQDDRAPGPPKVVSARADTEDAPTPAGTVVAWLQAPFIAVQFLTVMPAVIRRLQRADDLGRSEAFFPLVGLLLGAALAGADALLQLLVAPLVRDVALVAMLALLTGALHLDGVIDSFDGLFGGRDRERRLEVMRDPRAGSFGVVAVALLLAMKIAALASLPNELRVTSLLLAPAAGRWSIVLVTGVFPYARPEGMGQAFKAAVGRRHVALAGTIALVASALVAGAPGVGIWLAASTAALLVGWWVTSRLGGLTGDIYGAICELIETGVLLAFGLRFGSQLG